MCVENMIVVGGSIIFMNEVNCKWYEREKGGLVGQAHELIIICVGEDMIVVWERVGYDIHE